MNEKYIVSADNMWDVTMWKKSQKLKMFNFIQMRVKFACRTQSLLVGQEVSLPSV